MTNRTNRRWTTSGTLAALARPGLAVALAFGCSTLLVCQAGPFSKARKQVAADPVPVQSDEAVSTNGFRKEVTQDQQYNVHLEIGRVYEAQQQFEAAIAEYQKALEAANRRGFGSGVKGSGEKQALAHRRIGGALDRLGRFAQAETHYRAALKLSPDDAKVWNDAGYSYYMQSRWVDAERSLKTAARLAPDDIKIQTNLGLALAAQGKNSEALVALSKAGGEAVGHANLGYLLAAMGQTSQAREHYQKSLQLQPNLAPARQALAALQLQGVKAEQQPTVVATRPAARNTDANITRVTAPRVMTAPAPRIPTAAAPRPAKSSTTRTAADTSPWPTTPSTPRLATTPIRPAPRTSTAPSVTPSTGLPLTAPR